MSGRWIVLAVVVAVGCRAPFRKPAGLPCPPDAVECQPTEGSCPPESAATVECPPCAPKPQVEVRPSEEVHVHVPRQRVVVPRGGGAARVPGAGAPAAARTQAIEQQQIMQTRQVMLVPQQVLVPFVQTTTTGPIRVNGASETQILNVTGLANTTTGIAATGLTTAGLAAVGATGATAGAAVGTAGAAAPAAAAPAAAAAGAAAANPQSLNDCIAVLRQYEQEIRGLRSQLDQLRAVAAPPAVPGTPPAAAGAAPPPRPADASK